MSKRMMVGLVLVLGLLVLMSPVASADFYAPLVGTYRYTTAEGDMRYEITFTLHGGEYTVETYSCLQAGYTYDGETEVLTVTLPGLDDEPDEVEEYSVFFEDGFMTLAAGDSFSRHELLWQPKESRCPLTGRWVEVMDEEAEANSWWGKVYMELDDDGGFTIQLLNEAHSGEFELGEDNKFELEFLGEVAQGFHDARKNLVWIKVGEQRYKFHHLP